MYLVLANPTSGGGRGARVKRTLIDHLSSATIPFLDISGSSYESAKVNLKENLALHSPWAVIVIGGDGMVHLAIQELAGSDIPLLLIPAGTGNDFARSCFLDLKDPKRVFEHAHTSKPTPIDLGRVGDRFYAAILSSGFDALVNERANRMRTQSKRKYDLAMLLELPVFKPIEYRFDVDGKTFDTNAMLIAIANCPSYGGGMKICPQAKLNDGLLDLLVLEPVSKLELLKVFPKVYSGKHISHPKVRMLRGRNISITADALSYADGERIGSLPLSIEVVPNTLLTWVMK